MELPAVRSGYPPQALTTIPVLPLSSLGIKPGEQIIVNQKTSPAFAGSHFDPTVPGQMAPDPLPPRPPLAGPAAVETPSGVLVHRVGKFSGVWTCWRTLA